jgi:uncharacterized protein YjbJ (UPF0337 family)
MDTLRIKNWNSVKTKIKQHWGNLTDEDLTYVEGRVDDLIGRIQRRTGHTREEVVHYLNSVNK